MRDPRTALEDRLAAILRDAPSPMTVRDLGTLAGGQMIWPHQDGKRCRVVAGVAGMHGALHVECLGGADVGFEPASAGGHLAPELRSLEIRGLATRAKQGRVWAWRWIGEPADDMEEFESALACSLPNTTTPGGTSAGGGLRSCRPAVSQSGNSPCTSPCGFRTVSPGSLDPTANSPPSEVCNSLHPLV